MFDTWNYHIICDILEPSAFQNLTIYKLFCQDCTSWLPYSTYLHLVFFMLSRRWQPLQVCSKMFERLFRAGMSDLNHFFCKISMFDIWRLDLCDRFLPGCSHLTAGRLFLQTMSSSFEDFPRFRKFLVSGFSSFQEIPRFRNSSFQEFLISGFSWNEEILQIEKAAAKTTEPRAATILNVKLEH